MKKAEKNYKYKGRRKANFYIVWRCRTTTTEDESVNHVGDVKASRVNKSIWLDNSYKALSICTLLSALSALMSKVEVKGTTGLLKIKQSLYLYSESSSDPKVTGMTM